MKALSLHVTGIVQGVGFRPFVYNLALARGLTGWVLNASDGVYILVEGDAETVEAFPAELRAAAPPMAVIDAIIAEEVELEGFVGFEIRESRATDGAMTLVSPDIATCPECAAELFDPADRRHGYPFINCTNCGPRFTIISGVPYDRPATSMRDFKMCPECSAEYGDPADRRFHAQPDACFVCGPRLYLTPSPTLTAAQSADDTQTAAAPIRAEDPGDFDRDWAWTPERDAEPKRHRDRTAERARTRAILGAAAAMLRDGRILAIKGLGGYQLACDASNATAVAALRERKHRWGKPLAIMVRDLDAARRLGEIGPEEAALLSGTVRPIVLVRRAPGATPAPTASAPVGGAIPEPLAPSVADNLAEIGVMLPYTPLHHLLLAEMGDRPLVMTSGNLSDEPIATGDAEALARLGGIADAFLSHDREILSRYDDSVVRVVDGATQLIRRARGYAPYPLKLPFATDTDILAAGPEQKNTFTLLTGEHAFVSQHIGDMENAETLSAYEETLALYQRLFAVTPEIIAHDLHPEYLSTKWALARPQPKIGVQHHHAHVVSVTAEHGVRERVIGVAFDGTGYGEDGRIWGGEILLADWAGYQRFAHLAYVPMPGGAGAIRRPARMAIGTLTALGLLDHPGVAALRSRLAPGEEALLAKMIAGGVNCPLTSSMGRLFDAVAAIVGIADDARYEGEAAILLEAAADMTAEGTYAFALSDAADGASSPSDVKAGRAPHSIDPAPVVSALLDDVAARVPVGTVSARFHRAVAQCIVGVCETASRGTGIQHVALCGGVFMNRIVLGQAVRQLKAAGLTPLTHVRLPANDGAVSFGQAVVAWARRHDT